MDRTTLETRLQALIQEAHSSGLAEELRIALRQSLAAPPLGATLAVDGEPIPMRFGMVGASRAMQTVFDVLERVAPSDVSVLITGPTGAGKELVARALHNYSRRAAKPFLAENCAAVPAGLLESELFGHKKGAFTGAVADRDGHFVAASGGTVFLDEIGDMPIEMQAKMLRVLEERKVRPVGGNKTIPVDVRVIAATHRNLEALSKSGGFRADLYYRLNVITLEVPALKERPEDIPHLARFLLAQACKHMNKVAHFTPDALVALAEHPWPGNVRELSNVVQRAVALSAGEITRDDVLDPLLP